MPMLAAAPSAGKALLLAAILVVLLALVVWVLWKAAAKPKQITGLNPAFIFWLEMTYLGVLLVIAVLYNDDFYGIQKHIPLSLGNTVPIAVPWFGALGAVMISLQGVFEHNKEWDSSYNHWHIARPLFGAVLAIIAFLIFIVVVQTTSAEPLVPGTSPSPAVTQAQKPTARPKPRPAPNRPKPTRSRPRRPASPTPVVAAPTPTAVASPAPTTPTSPFGNNPLVYYIVAFLVGYREETFRALIKKATDVFFGPGETGPPAAPAPATPTGPSVDLIPPMGDHGAVAPGSRSFFDYELKNRSGSTITVAGAETSGDQEEWLVVQGSDGEKTWWIPESSSTVEDGASLWIRTQWSPPTTAKADSISQATLTVSFSGYEGSPKTTVLKGTVRSPA